MRRKPKILLLVSIIALLAIVAFVVGCEPESVESYNQRTDDAVKSGDFTWTSDTDCSLCHAKQAESLEDQNCLAYTHRANSCVTCHSDTDTLATVHEGATAEKAASVKRLKETTMDGTSCFTCHESYEALAKKTASSTVLTDIDGKVVNPHALPSNESHNKTQCSDCHTVHDEASLSDTAQKYCVTCHHGGKYECYTCHQ